jgi:GNAT superfamily N-acetyltransferase
MELHAVDLNHALDLLQQAKALYHSAFPKEERLPWWLLRLNACRQGIDLTAFTDGDVFCGFTASVTVEDLHFLLFFAIDDGLRGKGYGSAILQKLQKEHKTVVLNVELLDPAADNFGQRKRRFAFYRRNGFYDTGYHVWEVGGKFRVLSTDPVLDVPQYKKIFRKLSLGFWDVKLLPEKEIQ